MDKTVAEVPSVRGFIVEILSFDHLSQGKETDSCDFVYFSGFLSSWHPAFSRLVGRVVSLSRLMKKLVYIGKDVGRLMYVASEGTQLSFSRLRETDLSCRKRKRCGDEKGELGMYIGVVRGVYMQGMAIELDKEVWLLMTEESLVFTCSIRVGAIIRVRNVHIMSPKFRWGKMLVLGACSKTNITTISFSPWETGCHMVSKSQSHLIKFINSLDSPSRLWVLLVVQCFRKKFSGFFSEKEILGTKHKEGLVQTYARHVLPSSGSHLQHGLFMNFCIHDSCSSGSNVSYGNLSLAVPLSNFLGNCDRIWLNSILELKNGNEILEDCSQADTPFRENKLSDEPIRRILPSNNLGISLVGNLKLSQDTGRLQLTDATGCIDVLIPDLPADWNMNVTFEVVNYSIVLEGRPGFQGQKWVLDDDLFSCNSIFCPLVSGRQTVLTVYVHFYWTNIRCMDFPIHHCPSLEESSAKLDPGIFHVLCLLHKFPFQPQFHGDFFLSDSFRLFAEVMVVPWDLNVDPSNNPARSEVFSGDNLENSSHKDFALKRCKTDNASRYSIKTELSSNFEDFGNGSYSDSSNLLSLPHKTRNLYNLCGASPIQIPCVVSVRGRNRRSITAANLCYAQGTDSSVNFHSSSSRKLLLEFNYENMFKYKLMHIGAYYIMKHNAGKCFCDSDDINVGNKISINMEACLWSTSFHFNGVDSSSGPCNDPSCSCSICRSSSRRHLRNDLVLHPDSSAHGSFCDVRLHIATDNPDAGVQPLKEAVSSTNVSVHGQQVGFKNSVAGDFQNKGACFGNSLPEGKLISLRGTVMSLHCFSDGNLVDIHHSKKWDGTVCLRVLTDGQMLQIDGPLSKHNCPVGLSSGAEVTFHRILALSGQNRLILTPVSFVTVNIVKEALVDLYSSFSDRETMPSCLISNLIQIDACKPKRLRGRVVGVYIVILEIDKNLDKLLSSIRSGSTFVNIPFAGFILDDGTSRCFCWANGERAATFLRLHDKAAQVGCGSSWWRSKGSVISKSCSPPSVHLNNTLKKHGRVTIKNRGSIHDSLNQDLHLSNGSYCIFDTEDQKLLKSIIFNACASTFWSITGHVMDSNSVNVLEKFLMEEQMTVHALQNVWNE
ncbi:CST complex subunit CTC1 isoform X6 [Silene latifolia]